MKTHSLTTYIIVGLAILVSFYNETAFNNFIKTYDEKYLIEMIMIKINFITSIDVFSKFGKVTFDDSASIAIFLSFLVTQFKLIVTYKSLAFIAVQKFIRADGGVIQKTLKTLEFTILLKVVFTLFIFVVPDFAVFIGDLFSNFNMTNFNNWLENKLNFLNIF